MSNSDTSSDSDSSDVSMTTESDSDSDIDDSEIQTNKDQIKDSKDEENHVISEEEEEDDLIKAIKREKEKQRDHPPNINLEDHVVALSFHPNENILAIASVTGDVLMYKYSNEENVLLDTYELHLKSCRDIEFNQNGTVLFSTGKDKNIITTDVKTGKLMKCIDNAHDEPIYCLSVIDDNLFASGDDDGIIKLWDQRERSDKSLLTVRKNEDYISDMITNEEKRHLVCSSGDGSITTIDLRNTQFRLQSEEYEDELTCLGLFRMETKLLAGSSKGKMYLFNWNEFGLHSDEFPGSKIAINDMVPITENIVVSACEDGILRATHLFPHRNLGIVGQHELSVECVDICTSGTFIASSSHDNDVKFWNIQYFEDVIDLPRKVLKRDRKKYLQNNLPSSKRKNVADFFSDLNT